MALKLPRLQRTISIVDKMGAPGLAFHQWWQSVALAIEGSINDLTEIIARITGVEGSIASLTTDDVAEGSRLYFTDARSRSAISASGNLSYDSGTGVVTLSLPGGTSNFLRADGTWATPSGGGSYSYTVTSRSTSYSETATSGDQVVLVTGAAVTVSLPTAVGNTARFTFKLMVAGTMTLDGAGTETIDGALTISTSTQYTAITIASDNTNWVIV